MQCFKNIQQQSEPAAVALGCFDGVHIGHRKIICAMCNYAERKNLIPTVFTFDISPAAYLGRTQPKVITSQSDKANILNSLGVQKCFSPDFAAVADIAPYDFVEEILINKLNAKAVFCGFNYKFGKSAGGDTQLLKRICAAHGVEVFVTEPVCFDGDIVSSSRIRGLIESGEAAKANSLLSRAFSVNLPIEEGMHNGRTVGIPTINQTPPKEFVTPKYGVYASFATVNGKRYEAITNVGVRPTVGGVCKNYETHILGDFSEELYGQEVRVELLEFIRSERKFKNLAELSEQIKCDIKYIYDSKLFERYCN